MAPTLNPFDVLANDLVTRPRGIPPLGIAPGPRRFAQGMSATVTLALGAALLVGATRTAWLLEGIMVTAVVAVVFGSFCEGATCTALCGELRVTRQVRPASCSATSNDR